ncbi:MAG: hypothetical protein WDW38_008314 [Sanguina aurantia]
MGFDMFQFQAQRPTSQGIVSTEGGLRSKLAAIFVLAVRHKNVISTIMQSFITIGLISLLWVFLGYSLAFGDDINYSDNPPIVGPGGRRQGSIYGNPSTYYFFKDVGAAPNTGLAATIPNLLYALFQLMFAVITPALITGGFAERVNFPALALFVLLWHFVLYCPLAHSVWHFNGILKRFGTLDTHAVCSHMLGGGAHVVWVCWAGGLLVPGSAQGDAAHRNNVPFTLLGTALLWFGWFGFNAGSALAANVVAVQAFCTTNTAAGALDFAGGTVVHINAGIAGLVGAYMVGPRLGLGREPMKPHNVTFTMVGAALLWVGWFGFNAGSNLEANSGAALAFINTLLATAAAVLAWLVVEAVTKGKPSMLGGASGAVAGLVAITPACGTVGPMGSLVIGALASVCCVWGVTGLKKLLKVDDALDVFGVHGIGGIVGALLTGVFSAPLLGGTGFGPGNTTIAQQLGVQALGVSITLVWSGVVSVVVYLLTDMIIPMRVDEASERLGLDVSQHGEKMMSPPLDDEEFLNRINASVHSSVHNANRARAADWNVGSGAANGAGSPAGHAAGSNGVPLSDNNSHPGHLPNGLASSGNGIQRVSALSLADQEG